MNGAATKEEKEQVKTLFPLMDEFALTQEITEGTRQTNTLDLLFTNNLKIINISVTPSQQTDHNFIEISTNMSLVKAKYYDQISEKNLAN